MKPYGTLLAVDDSPAILTALRLALEGAFERVVTIDNPDLILRKLERTDVSLILLDMNFSLGVNSGQEGLFWLRALRKRYPEVPVVLLTAYADVSLAVRGLKAGAADFIVKPWDNGELVRKLHEAVDRQREVHRLEDVETEHMRHAVEVCNGNLTKAAEMLGISRQTLYNKIRKNG